MEVGGDALLAQQLHAQLNGGLHISAPDETPELESDGRYQVSSYDFCFVFIYTWHLCYLLAHKGIVIVQDLPVNI